MLKKEIAKLLETLKDDDAVDEVVSKSDLGKALVTNGLTLDTFKTKVESDPNFKSFMDSEKDKHHTKALETWKNNNLNKMIDDEIKKRFPGKDPKDVELEKMKAEIEKMKAETFKKDLTNKALKTVTDKKLPTELVDFFVGADEETTNKNLEVLSKVFSTHDEALKTELLKGTYKPGGNGGSEPTEESVKAQVNSIFGIN